MNDSGIRRREPERFTAAPRATMTGRNMTTTGVLFMNALSVPIARNTPASASAP